MPHIAALSDEQISDEAMEILDEIERGMDRRPNLFRTYAHHPLLLRANWQKLKATMMEGALPRKLKGDHRPARKPGQRLRVLHPRAFDGSAVAGGRRRHPVRLVAAHAWERGRRPACGVRRGLRGAARHGPRRIVGSAGYRGDDLEAVAARVLEHDLVRGAPLGWTPSV